MDEIWTRLLAPFAPETLDWRILRLSDDAQKAQLRPQLSVSAVLARLDAAVTPQGWSNQYLPLGVEAVICTLTVQGVSKSAVSDAPFLSPAARAQDALVRAAEMFGLLPPAPQDIPYWADYNPEAGEILYEPEVSASLDVPAVSEVSEVVKPAGQQAIDRLVERLKEQGLGLQAAKLISAYGGYGANPEQARELYGRLRNLLKSPERP